MATVQAIQGIREAFTFDDVLLKPGLSDVLPGEAGRTQERCSRERLLDHLTPRPRSVLEDEGGAVVIDSAGDQIEHGLCHGRRC